MTTSRSEMPMKRDDVTDLILFRRVKLGLKWADVAERVGQSKEWVTAACMGQMQMTRQQAETVGKLFDLPEDAVLLLQTVPYKGSLPTAVPTDPLIYRWYEVISVYGTTIKELIHEEFGDGIMSAIDFSMDIRRESDPKGDRVNVVLSGKFLPYKTFRAVTTIEPRRGRSPAAWRPHGASTGAASGSARAAGRTRA